MSPDVGKCDRCHEKTTDARDVGGRCCFRTGCAGTVQPRHARAVDLCECGAVVATGVVFRSDVERVIAISCPICKGDKRSQLAKVGRATREPTWTRAEVLAFGERVRLATIDAMEVPVAVASVDVGAMLDGGTGR